MTYRPGLSHFNRVSISALIILSLVLIYAVIWTMEVDKRVTPIRYPVDYPQGWSDPMFENRLMEGYGHKEGRE